MAESLFDELKDKITKEDKILIPRAKNARDYLVDKLSEICDVKEVHTYESVIDTSKKEEILELLGDESLDYITFASSSTVRNFVEIIGEENLDKIKSSKVISIGPVTSATAKELNIEVYREAEKATIDKIVEAITVS